MEINKEKIISLNKRFGGSLVNEASLSFAIDKANKEKNIYKKCAYLIRGIVVYHPFLDGNKRTALMIISGLFMEQGMKCDKEKLTKGLINIARQNIHDINKISKRLRKWCIKN